MRIHDGSGNEIREVYVALTDDEAKQMIDYLEALTTARAEDAEHWHISDVTTDPSRVSAEITIYRADDPSARW